ncbi:metalloprotease family protein [Fictibacillus aquaticus]|uniref:DUF3267 domain-containing protein n=1 Tax=Fictibacillus aquaticus TaxID=2021314 RepID=A0A235F6C5_9BACL|nr:metalloprotease family protein [Fictibacillus aquaticus]OYD56830.1 hypothetical protein CGZ90_14845 [Fictibacillus aquaticus]
MNCYKSINIQKTMGSQRLLILSLFSGLAFFMLFYDLFLAFFPETIIIEAGGWPFLLSILFILPVHKIGHCLPLWLSGIPAGLVYKRTSGSVPYIHCQFKTALSLKIMKLSVLSPFFLITSGCFASAYSWPVFMPFFITFAAVNFALSIYDFIYYSCLLKAPKEALIEDHDINGFFILINEKVS